MPSSLSSPFPGRPLLGSSDSKNRIKLRTSCDPCQAAKVKCGQEKPSCYRCVKQRLTCTYSPLRRIGRPRKGTAAAVVETNPRPQQHRQHGDGRLDSVGRLQQMDVMPNAHHQETAISTATTDVDPMDNWPGAISPISLPVSHSGPTDDSNSALTTTAGATGPNNRLAAQLPQGHGHGHGATGNGDFSVMLDPEDTLADFCADTLMDDPQTLDNSLISSSSHRISTTTITTSGPDDLAQRVSCDRSWAFAATTTPRAINEDSYGKTVRSDVHEGHRNMSRIHGGGSHTSSYTSANMWNDFISSDDVVEPATSVTGSWFLNSPLSAPPNGELAASRHWSHDRPAPHGYMNDNNNTNNNNNSNHLNNNHMITDSPPIQPVSPSNPASRGSRRRSPRETTGSGQGTGREVDCKAQCYLSLLRRLAQLEQSLATNPQPLAVDFVLTVERDTRALKERLFGCRGRNPRSAGEVVGSTKGEDGCLHSRPSSLLVLALLAERVVGMLEDLFRRAAVSAHALERALRTTWSMNPTSSTTRGAGTTLSQQSAASARLERSVRSAFDRNITCPVPEANCELMIGNYELDVEVKARAMKRILRLRIRKLAAMLADLGASLSKMMATAAPSGGADVGGALGALLGGGGSSIVLSAAKSVVEDLHRRVESLQGRVELAE